jgi:predicted DNA binding protein
MEFFEMRMEVRHDCPFSNISAKFPEVTIRVWCNTRTHIIELWGGSDEELEAMLREPKLVGEDHIAFPSDRSLRIVSRGCDCSSYPGVTEIIDEHECWYLEPSLIKGGWEQYRVFSYGKENLNLIVNEIQAQGGEVKVLSLKQLAYGLPDPFLPSSSILAGLTDRQISTLAEAFCHGYFEEPSQVSADNLANRMGVSRSTFSEHLRKAERKLIANLYPVIRLAVCDCQSGLCSSR